MQVQSAAPWMLAALVPLGACGLEPKGGPRAHRPESPAAARCPFEPVAIVIHPLTRLVVEKEDRASIDAHVEFRDAAGDEVKAVGTLVLELYRETGPVSGMGGRQHLLRWESDLADPDENSRAYDRVTRTYRFELKGVAPSSASDRVLLLRAVLTPPGGRALEDESVIGR